MSTASNNRGFTLMEVMIAMTLLSIGMLGAVGLQVTTINANRFGGHATQAMLLAEEKIAYFEGLDFNAPQLTDNGGNPGAANDFSDPDRSNSDIASASQIDGCETNAINTSGVVDTTMPLNGTLGFQRCWQIEDQDLNTQIDGMDAKRIRVIVRFSDGQTSIFRQVSVTFVKTRQF